MTKRVILSWSSGKDSAWSLYQLQQDPDVEVVGLLTTFNEQFDRVAMHGVRRSLVELQARAAALPLIAVPLPWPCSNEKYEAIMANALEDIREEYQPTHIAFGDLFLEDIREYRLRQMQSVGIECLFPIWQLPTLALAKEMVIAGVQAILTCVDSSQLDKSYSGRYFDDLFLGELPSTVDPCGENGEFHTVVVAGPMFNNSIAVEVGETVERDGFVFTDVIPLSEPKQAHTY